MMLSSAAGVRRVGVDMGGGLARGDRVVDGAQWGMMCLQQMYGADNVVVVSFAGQRQRGQYAKFLWDWFDIKADRVRWCDERTGPAGVAFFPSHLYFALSLFFRTQ